MNEDLNQLGVRKIVQDMFPKECNYMFSPGQLFNKQIEK